MLLIISGHLIYHCLFDLYPDLCIVDQLMSHWILLKIFFEQLINIFWKDLRDSVSTQLHRWA